ncbi:MAG: AAA family ATPase [Neptuniibacter caesariensis]|uniref:AAA family ATPase n=1 Tax=Neptuniibacter caesariensis TaxID=207954 RepID=A0A2G6JAU2_NEPCE|nr:MAG: AAA family ATPase [Neptuniibacter caesariensis]
MYTEHFGLRELPFTLTPNTHFFLNMPTHHEALNLILVALAGGDGFVKVVGEVGTGKTLLCRKLLNALEGDQYVTAYIPNPYLSPDEFRKSFAQEIGLDITGLEHFELLNAINHKLIELAHAGKKVVLLVDEAQAIPEDTIEALRLLTNLETESSKLFQVVLFGQPELDELLAQKSLRQLLQRITFSYELNHLDAEAVEHYIDQRVQRAGFQGMSLFKRGAARKIAKASGGTPRLINILSHKALLAAYGKGDMQVDEDHVLRAIDDTQKLQKPKQRPPLTWGMVVVLLLAVAVIAYVGGGL